MIPAAPAILVGILGVISPDPKGDLAKRLAAPLSPGAVALLTDTRDPAVIARIDQALHDPRSETRAAAARVVTVRRIRELQNAVEEALAEETDAEAAREEMRALLAIETAPHDEMLYATSDRFERRLDPDLAKMMARQRGSKAMPALLSGRPWNLTPGEWANAVWLSARGDASGLVPPMARALGSGDAARWDALLRVCVTKKTVAGLGVVGAGLSSPVPGVAARAAWYAAWVRQRGPGEADGQLISEARAPEGSDAETAYAFELLGRSLGRPADEAREWNATFAANRSLVDEMPPNSPWFALMTDAEREAARRRYEYRNKGAVSPGKPTPKPASKPPRNTEKAFNLRAMSGLPRGVPEDALRVAGCKTSKGTIFGLVAVQYYPDGIPRAVSRFDIPVSDACDQVALSLGVLTLAPDEELPIPEDPKPDVLFAVARPDCLSVLEEADVCPSVCPEDRDEVRTVGGSVEAPKLLERVQPRYYEGFRRERKEGVVVLEAIISTEGCVQDVQVLESADPALDLEAARAVTQWKYRPALLGGRPVRVYLTVTVTFRLN